MLREHICAQGKMVWQQGFTLTFEAAAYGNLASDKKCPVPLHHTLAAPAPALAVAGLQGPHPPPLSSHRQWLP